MLGRCLVTSVKRGNFDIITVVLGSDTKRIRTSDSIKLIEYAFANYEQIDIGKMAREEFEIWRRTNQNRIYIYKGRENHVTLTLDTQIHTIFPVNKSDVKDLTVEIIAVNYLEAPIYENEIIRNGKCTNK